MVRRFALLSEQQVKVLRWVADGCPDGAWKDFSYKRTARDRAREKDRQTPKDKRKAPARLVEGATVQGWKQALGALALHYPDRLAPYIR